MNVRIRTIAACVIVVGLSRTSFSDERARVPDNLQVTRIGAVAYSPAAVTIFDGLTRYLNRKGLPSDYVLYSNYDSLVAALGRGEIDIAWNTPLAHARFHVQNQCASQTLVMRDVDVGVCSVLVARADSGIQSLQELAGKKLILGSLQAAEATVLPVHFLKKEGVDFSQIKMVSLDSEVDSQGNPCASPQHVFQALREGRGDAGIVTTELWSRVKDGRREKESMKVVWTSPPFSHCVFTAAAKFDKDRAERFTKLMQEMDPDERATADVMRLEGTKKWLPGSPDGFKDLIDALSGK
jgi:ABC-type phosphate/phosphonate transport system substrate-binding protein